MNQLTELESERTEQYELLDFAVIGAGIAGLTAASNIIGAGYSVAVFEKARGTGGRLSSKRAAYDDGKFMAFDLGCVSITAESSAFSDQLQRWHASGVIAPWWKDDQNQTHYVALPRNSGLTRHLSTNIECHFSNKITSIQRIADTWHLFSDDGENVKLLAKSKNVIIAAPPAQAFDLLPADHRFKRDLENVTVGAQWVVGLEVNNDLSASSVMTYPQSGSIFSISQESRKPGRRDSGEQSDNECSSTILQIQASAEWTQQHLELSQEKVCSVLISELEHQLQQPLSTVHAYAHRWLYSCVTQGINNQQGYLWDEQGLGVIGDYFNIATNIDSNTHVKGVESAWLSGKQLSDWLMLVSN
jgi:predicted NAD/FAD-dependent oxidoreductase